MYHQVIGQWSNQELRSEFMHGHSLLVSVADVQYGVDRSKFFG